MRNKIIVTTNNCRRNNHFLYWQLSWFKVECQVHMDHISIYSSDAISENIEDLKLRCASNFLHENVPICHSDSAVKTQTRDITIVGRKGGRKSSSTFPRNKLFFPGKIGGAKRHKYWQTTTINRASLTINVDKLRERFGHDGLHDATFRDIHRSIIISVRSSQCAVNDNRNCFVNSLIPQLTRCTGNHKRNETCNHAEVEPNWSRR